MSDRLPELPLLPEPYKAPQSMFCASCGAPYEPSRAFLAPCAAGMGAPLYSNHGCKCGGNSFRGTIDSNGPTAQYTADQMRAYARAALEAHARALAPQWVSVDERLPEQPDDDSDVPVWTWDGQLVAEDEYAQQWEQPAGPCVGGWITTGYGFTCDGVTRQATHWMPRETPKPPAPKG